MDGGREATAYGSIICDKRCKLNAKKSVCMFMSPFMVIEFVEYCTLKF